MCEPTWVPKGTRKGAMMDTLELKDYEYAELARLVAAERSGEDVQYAAFSALCPTGEEGAFDGSMCDVYRALHAGGFVDGESDGEAFYFSALTPFGRSYVEKRELEAEEGGERSLWQQDGVGEIAFETVEPESGVSSAQDGRSTIADDASGACGADGSSSGAAGALNAGIVEASGVNVKLILLAAVVGFAAGILGGAVGAYIVVAVL